MNYNPILLSIRKKKLGVLIRDARLATHHSLDACAQAIGVAPDDFEAIELGEVSLSLPRLELIAYYLNVPLEHFWGNKALSEDHSPAINLNIEQLIGLRQRMIGALLRQARLEAELSSEETADGLGIPQEDLEACEMGEAELPVPLLEVFSELTGHPLKEFMDQHGPVGRWSNQQLEMQDFLSLPDELQEFVSRPINRPYLELAQRLSEMSVDKLHAVGEGILEITL